MSTNYYQGTMANRSIDERETDVWIRILLGLPMVDDGADYFAMYRDAIEERDETIVDLWQKIEDQKEASRDLGKELNATIRQLQSQLTKEA